MSANRPAPIALAGPAACLALILGMAFVSTAQEKKDDKASGGLKFATAKESKAEYDRTVRPFFARHCNGCHNAKKSEGELDLDRLDPDMKQSTSAGRWALLLEKLATREMPPDSRPRPDDESVLAVVGWIQAEMKRSGRHSAKRQSYANGNSLSHRLLFDAKQQARFDSPTRVRLLSPEIYWLGFDLARSGSGLAQPFSPMGGTTFRDMGSPKADEPVTTQLLANAVAIVEKQTAFAKEGDTIKPLPGSVKELVGLMDEKSPLTKKAIESAVTYEFGKVLARKPTEKELAKFVAFMEKNVKDAGRVKGVRYVLAAVFLLPEAVFRFEVGGTPDKEGRVRLTPREIAFALAYALTDRKPDPTLLADAEKGKLDTRQGVAAAVTRMLDDGKLQKPRILRFFREYFGYEAAKEVFKNDKDNPEHDARVLVEDTDRLVEYVLEQDKNVLSELLTTNKTFVAYKSAADTKKKRAAELAKFEANRKKDPKKFEKKQPPKVGRSVYEAYNLSDFPDKQPVELPKEQRAGVLTQPAWLVAQSTSFDNHAIHRGKWVRERLLGGVVPDVPITVDAQLPDAPEKTLRERMKVTQDAYCWKCHRLMNDVGLPFEAYDHFGRFRTKETVLDVEATKKNVDKKGKPLGPVMGQVDADAGGLIALTGEPEIEGKVKGAVEMLHRMAKAGHVEQVFVRHAFRYWMGRNETLGDGPSLRAAHKAYRESGGSMKALVAALLSSDSFLYRVPSKVQK